MKVASIAAGALAALLALTACSSSSSGSHSKAPTTSRHQSAVTGTSAPKITIKNFGFSGTMTVKPGAKVTVVNQDSTAHTLTDKATHKFDTGNIAPNGGTGTFTAPTKAGKYPFGCSYHPEMSGTLIVHA